MKILDLKLCAFGPFAKEQHIPFEQLNYKGMYLIEGPTGTGKTSIFDAIMFALYGKASGKDRNDSKGLRSDFASPNDITYVDLKFEANQQIYRIYRTCDYSRPKSRGTGFTEEKGKVELHLPNGEKIFKSDEVSKKIVNDILFIDCDQFKNIALLAQGEFTELITATSKERAPILERIFNKSIYDTIQREIGEKYAIANSEQSKIISSLQTLIKNIENGESIIGYKEALGDPFYTPTLIENIGVLRANLSEQAKIDEKNVSSLQDIFTKANSQLDSINNKNIQIKNYIIAKTNLNKLNEKEPVILKNFELSQQYDEFVIIRGYLNSKSIAENNVAKFTAKISEANTSLAKTNEDLKQIESQRELFNQKRNEVTNLNTNVANLSNLLSIQKVLAKDRKTIELLDVKVSKLNKQLEDVSSKFAEIRRVFFASSSYNLAKELKEGEPCPVCGSVSHPKIAVSSETISEATYLEEEKNLKEFSSNVTNVVLELRSKRSDLEAREKSFLETLSSAGIILNSPEEIYSLDLQKKIDDLEMEINKLKEEIKKFDDSEKNLLAAKKSYEDAIKNNSEYLANANETIRQNDEHIQDCFKSNKFIKTIENCSVFMSKGSPINDILNRRYKDEYNKFIADKAAALSVIKNTPDELKLDAEIDVSSVKNNVEEAKQNYEAANAALSALNNRIANLNTALKGIKTKYDECKTVIENCESLRELNDIARGNNKKKLSFKMYVLSQYFEKIIFAANIRLNKITNGRYTLIRRTTVSGNSLQGLDLDVYDAETGKARHASSLSGGEKFVSALSMALGLSDIIESNKALIQVESIFIDEGFGSLDENYLDMAMKALDSLKNENKSVAIISHVEKLKEYIVNGIEVKKDDIGSTIVIKNLA